MTSLDEMALFDVPPDPARPEREPRKCPHPNLYRQAGPDGRYCARCGHVFDVARSRLGRNNRARGNRAELDVARTIGGEKVGPLGHPWDVVVGGLWRIQVRKYLRPESLRRIAAELARIATAPGPEAPAYVWVEPGRGGEQLITMRLRDFTAYTGIKVPEDVP